jgi:hypothetical protein
VHICFTPFSGVATNLPIAALGGWTQCYSDTYALAGTPLLGIFGSCPQANLLLGCRATGSSTLDVAAYAPRADVSFDTGTSNVPHNANGVGWYYNGNYSWGFAPEGDPINRNACDTVDSSLLSGTDGDKRLCWHTLNNALNNGWRCGRADSLNFSSAYERLVFEHP